MSAVASFTPLPTGESTSKWINSYLGNRPVRQLKHVCCCLFGLACSMSAYDRQQNTNHSWKPHSVSRMT